MKTLYHGSVVAFNSIDVKEGKGFKDFGKGFYATAYKSHADSLAIRNKGIFERIEKAKAEEVQGYKMCRYHAYRYVLNFEDSCLTSGDLKVKIFNKPDLEWVTFILENRRNSGKFHDYDIVIGPTADSKTTIILNQYKNASLRDLESLIKELEPDRLPKQYFFGTEKSLKYLRILRRELV